MSPVLESNEVVLKKTCRFFLLSSAMIFCSSLLRLSGIDKNFSSTKQSIPFYGKVLTIRACFQGKRILSHIAVIVAMEVFDGS
jgi:hypothetical protein